ncbi:MAG: hypothetical protein M3N32_00935, partial [Actinomycetota bacterium]|nr:hypothetical protein [Actinomycetota bacterium]
IVDAFSSDAIPVHLMTSEAVELYRSKLAPGGLIVFHISNRHMDLEPVVAGIARHQGLAAAVRTATLDPVLGSVTWAVLAETSETLAPLTAEPAWQPLVVEPGRELVWTDDFSNVVRVLEWRLTAATGIGRVAGAVTGGAGCERSSCRSVVAKDWAATAPLRG